MVTTPTIRDRVSRLWYLVCFETHWQVWDAAQLMSFMPD
jgi:hypothetical protein